MTAKELRVGNLVNTTTAGNVCNTLVPIEIIDGTYIDNAEWFFPIPLTTEWLERFGFDVGNNFYFTRGDFDISYIDDDIIYERYTVRWQKSVSIKIQYVHQLQNLYFALTGEELEHDKK